MKQAAKMQEQMEQIQAQLAARTVEATSGGGVVKVVAKCDGTIASIKIDPQALNPADAQIVEDMIVTAANQALGYGGTYVTKAPAHVAVLPVGYADGYNRQLSNRGRVIVRDHYAPIVGSISMDLTLVDVTGIPEIAVGDEVILLGTRDGLSVDALEHARLANSSPYEILCNISKRVPRKYGS